MMTSENSIIATPEMAALCFTVVTNHLNGNGNTKRESILPAVTVGGMFVTWETSQGQLRGCIGTVAEVPLARLFDYAVKASQFDSRFSPINLREIQNISCTVSILHCFESCSHSHDWEIGTHGIIVQFSLDGIERKSTFLPNVMVEQRWSKDQAIDAAIEKFGCRGITKLIRNRVIVTRYKASKSTLSHQEYIKSYSQ